jgi:hypothetical protein
MNSLQDAIARFQQEISRSLASRPGATGELHWEVERVALTLNVTLDSNAPDGSAIVLCARQDNTAEKVSSAVTIEFRVRRDGSELSPPAGAGNQVVHPGASAGTGTVKADGGSSPGGRAIAALTELLGPPGFDSSARAAVMCDALRELTAEQSEATANALTRPASEVRDPKIREARHSIRGVVQSGPLKSFDRAVALLTELFRSCSTRELVRQIEQHWKTADHW